MQPWTRGQFVGRAPEQVDEFLAEAVIAPITCESPDGMNSTRNCRCSDVATMAQHHSPPIGCARGVSTRRHFSQTPEMIRRCPLTGNRCSRATASAVQAVHRFETRSASGILVQYRWSCCGIAVVVLVDRATIQLEFAEQAGVARTPSVRDKPWPADVPAWLTARGNCSINDSASKCSWRL